jgi:hypothetical protein
MIGAMALFRKRPDPISVRSRALQSQIQALETEIRLLSEAPTTSPADPEVPPERVASFDPVFETIDHGRKARVDERGTPAHYNQLGARKYDPMASWHRLLTHLRGPTANNPRLINYLAAGSIQGLRPLRYEKRVARNRLLTLAALLLLVLWGIGYALTRR